MSVKKRPLSNTANLNSIGKMAPALVFYNGKLGLGHVALSQKNLCIRFYVACISSR